MIENFIIGIVRSSHGLDGKFRVESTSNEMDHFSKLKQVTLQKNGVSKVFAVESVDIGSCIFMKCVGIDTPEDAKKFSGWEILAPRSFACPLEKNEFYVQDLKQCKLVYADKDGLVDNSTPIEVGIITDVLEGGADDLLEVSISESFGSKFELQNVNQKRLVPFRKEFIGRVDMTNYTVELIHLWVLE